MSLIAEYSVTARPDRGLVEVYDADAYAGSDEAYARSRVEVVAGDGFHLYLQTRHPDIAVRVTIRVWDAPQQPPEDAEGTVPVSLESETGRLVIGQVTFGPAGEMVMPRPGVYEGHATWSGRAVAAACCDVCNQRGAEGQGDSEGTVAEWSRCPRAEEYTLDLRFVRESDPEDDEEA
ncbi:hypothetical protein ACWGBV_01640 [Streptomyces sp. NPDC055051]